MSTAVPASTSDRFQRVDAVFDALLDLPTAEQVAYLDRTCSEDPALRDEVLQLLRAHHHSGGILDAGLTHFHPDHDGKTEANERIGPFRIIRPIGQGGMGQVYLGQRDDNQFEQRVALKLIRHPSSGVVRRFVEERRILARLEHPRIARLIDGGITPDGMPYFAMEFIDGEPIDRFCESRNLSLDERLMLFEQVCEAMSYAHQHLVIHRDLKPANILVTADGQVKLLDFGIAKVMDATARDETRTGLRVMTPEVAAPEQVRGDAISTATDVYALGILLYQLITGRRPYEVRGKSPAEFERIVCEFVPDEPSEVAPMPIRRRVKGDLDLIVMTALQKHVTRRYQSTGALALDVHRFRNGFAIQARPDSARYRLSKFISRHRPAAALSVIVLLAVLAGVARERSLRNRAEIAARTARAAEAFLIGVFDVADPLAYEEEARGTITARDLLDRGARRVDSTLVAAPEVQAELRAVLGRVYTNLGLYNQATPLLERSLAQRRTLNGTADTSVATGMDLLGLALMAQDKYDDAEPLLTGALALRRAALGNFDATTSESAEHLASLYEERGRYAAAESLHTETLMINQRVFGDSSIEAANSLNNIALVHYRDGTYAEAVPLYRRALAIHLRRLGERNAVTAATMHNLGQVLDIMGKTDEAEEYYRRSLAAKRAVLGDLHPSVTIGMNNFGQFLALTRGRLDEAEAMTREAVGLDRQIFGENHTYVAEGLRNLGIILRTKGEFTRADSALRAAIEMDRRTIGDRNTKVGNMMGQLAQVRYQMNDMPGATRYTRESLSRLEEALGDKHRNTNVQRTNLARMLMEGGGRLTEAESLVTVASTRLDSVAGATRPQFIINRRTMGEVLLAQRRVDEALPILASALEMSRKTFGEDQLRTANAKVSYARALMATGRYVEAAPLLLAADPVIQKARTGQPRLAAQLRAAMAMLASTGRASHD